MNISVKNIVLMCVIGGGVTTLRQGAILGNMSKKGWETPV